MEENGLFEHYEIRNWDITSRIYKILGASAIINVLILFAFGQFNLLNTRGCDTPYIGMVCQVLDSAYVASTFLGKDNSWESRPYGKTEIGDDEVVTIIDVSNPLTYPEGYFALANPEEFSKDTDIAMIDPSAPGDPTVSNPAGNTDLVGTPQVTPTPNKEVGDQKLPEDLFKFEDKPSAKTPSVAKTKTPKPGKRDIMSNESPTTLGNKTAQTTPKPTPESTPTKEDAQAAKDEFKETFNKAPLQVFADGIVDKVFPKDTNTEKIDLKQAFTVVFDGSITKEGKLETSKGKITFIKGEGNEEMVKVAKEAIAALGDSQLFIYLARAPLNIDKVKITLVQDDKQISADITSVLPNNERAKTVSSGFNGLVQLANWNTSDDKDVQTLLKATKFKAEGKNFTITFAMPKEDAHKLIDQKLQEARQKKSQTNNSEFSKDQTAQQGK